MSDVLIVKNIPSPYRNFFFNELNRKMAENESHLKVLYCANIEKNRKWILAEEDFQYNYKVYSGVHFTFWGIFIHFNPSLLFKLLFVRDKTIIIGGYGTLTLLLAPFLINNQRNKLIVWSETYSVFAKKGRIVEYIRTRFYKRFSYSFFPGMLAKHFLEQYNPELTKHGFQLPNTINEEVFLRSNEINKDAVYQSLNIDATCKSIFTVARLEDFKGLIHFFEALPVDHQLNWIIAGEGSLKEQLLKMASTKPNINLCLLGNLTEEKVMEMQQCADVFCLPSLHDPSPLSVIEAIAVGKPILVSQLLGNYHEVFDGNGWSFDPKQTKQIENAIHAFINADSKELIEMGKQSKAIFDSRFNSNAVIKRMILFLNSVGK